MFVCSHSKVEDNNTDSNWQVIIFFISKITFIRGTLIDFYTINEHGCFSVRWHMTCIWKKYIFLFVTYTTIQSITSSEMCSLHLTHPSAHTPGAVGNRRCGARGAVGGSVPCSRVSPQSWIQFLPEPEIWTHNLGLHVQRSIIGHGCPLYKKIWQSKVC